MSWTRGYEHHEDPPEENIYIEERGKPIEFSPSARKAFWGGLVGSLAGFAISRIPQVYNFLASLNSQTEGLAKEINEEKLCYLLPVAAGAVIGAGVGLGIEAYRHLRDRKK